jgi:hypothetical protein
MAIEVEFFTLTGPITDLILKHPPSTGIDGFYDIAVDPIGGPAQRGPGTSISPVDFDYIGNSETGILTYNISGSDIKEVRQGKIDSGLTGPVLRVLYNY